MIINTYRFGDIEFPSDKLISMERPILGFEKLDTFCLIESEDLAPLLWLQSAEDPHVGFLVANPLLFFDDYRIEINSMEIAELEVNEVQAVETYVIMTIEKETGGISANLQGPILINSENNRAKQLVLVNSEYEVRHTITGPEDTVEETEMTASEQELVPA